MQEKPCLAANRPQMRAHERKREGGGACTRHLNAPGEAILVGLPGCPRFIRPSPIPDPMPMLLCAAGLRRGWMDMLASVSLTLRAGTS